MLTRRTVLGLAGAGAAAIGVPMVASALFSRAEAADGLPVTIVNSTGVHPNAAIRMYVVGTDPAGNQGYASGSGVFTPLGAADAGSDGALDIAVRLSPSGSTPFTLPRMSGRIYFAIDGELAFRAVVDAAGRPALQYPVGWLATDPSYQVLHDFFEFTHNDAGMFCNTTMVDMFSIPMSARLTGAGEAVTGKLVDGGRDAIFTALAAQPGFERLVVGDRIRAIAPGHGIGAGLFSPTYFDGYIEEIWSRYSSESLRVSANNGTCTGRVDGSGRLAFDNGAGSFARPTTQDVFFCDGALLAPNDGVSGPVAAVLGAGFNRSVLDRPDQPVTDAAAFYRQPVTNHYARILHEATADHRAYGFPFDDVTGAAAYIEDHQPTHLEITLTPFGTPAGRPADPPPASAAAPAPASAPAAPPAGRDAYARIAADGFADQSGIQTEATTGGGRHIGFIANGDWVRYAAVDFGTAAPANQFVIRTASGAPPGVSGLVEVRLDGPGNQPAGTVAVADTGGWQSWREVPGNLAPVTGVHDVYLTFTSGQPQEYVNISWLTFRR
ncbi:beta-1,3-glucanase family protein [Plantactinospora sp. KBS50]|uniref:beta-1,3-glucanase family protein n=1 Tax=Plantactinospora sp. KBS50 TaxID=2024580 RepID=UPI0012FE3E4E|nr:beta-1,3-glucanase family protein [Plantactinospora sp. KBS50]